MENLANTKKIIEKLIQENKDNPKVLKEKIKKLLDESKINEDDKQKLLGKELFNDLYVNDTETLNTDSFSQNESENNNNQINNNNAIESNNAQVNTLTNNSVNTNTTSNIQSNLDVNQKTEDSVNILEQNNNENNNTLETQIQLQSQTQTQSLTDLNKTEVTGLSIEEFNNPNSQETLEPLPLTETTNLTIDPDNASNVTSENNPENTFLTVEENNNNNETEEAEPEAEPPVVNTLSILNLSVDKTVIQEGSTGTFKILTYTISRDNSVASSSVEWILTGVQSEDLEDGQAVSGFVEFSPGEKSKTFTVKVLGDKEIESDESIKVELLNPGTNTKLGNSEVNTDVLNDDGKVSVTVDKAQIQEGNEGDVTEVTFTITRENSIYSSTLDWDISGIDLENLEDDASLNGTLEFSAGETTKTITIKVLGNDIAGKSQELKFNISNPGDNLILDNTASSTQTDIINDDIGFTISSKTINVLEGTIGETSKITFTVTRSEDMLGTAMSIDYILKPVGENAVEVSDFVSGQDSLETNSDLPSGTLNFGATELTKEVIIDVKGDENFELDESFAIVLENAPSGVQVSVGSVYGKILTDESSYSIVSLSPETQLEGNTEDSIFKFEITKSGYLANNTTLEYQIIGIGENTANDEDFTSITTNSVTFAAGETTKTISVNVSADNLLEGFEAFKVALVETATNHISIQNAYGVIATDDAAITITGDNSIVKEGNTSANTHTYTVTRSEYLDSEVIINWEVVGNSTNPVNAEDFAGTLPNGTVTFAAGETTKTIEFAPSVDLDYEENENYDILLTTNQNGVIILTPSITGTILNDEAGLTLEATNLNTYETTASHIANTISFNVARSGDITGVTTVDWELIPDSIDGVSADDFVANTLFSGNIEFAKGETNKLITLALTNDAVIEADEGFTVKLSNSSYGSQILVGEVSGAILNDDAAYSLLDTQATYEGNSEYTNVIITVKRDGDTSSYDDTVDYTITPSSGSTIDASDFFNGAFPSGTVYFNDDSSTKDIIVKVKADSILELDEAFDVTLSNPSADSTISDFTTTVTILNDDSEISISSDQVQKNESSDGETSSHTFTVTRTGSLDHASTVTYSVIGSGSNQANASDFVGGSLPTDTVTFAAGESSKTITIDVKGDSSNEADETFDVVLSNPSLGSIITADTASSQITNDDTGFTIAATDTDNQEGDTGTTTHTFTVTRTGITTGSNTVNWTIEGTGSNPASSDDFDVTSGSVTFAAGETTKTIEVSVIGDTDVEPNENFNVVISTTDNNTDVQKSTALGTIVSDDIGFEISSSQDSLSEGTTGKSNIITFTVTRSGDLASPVDIDWTATGLNSSDFVDGTVLNDTLSFAANQTTETINLKLKGDVEVESDETLTVTLSTNNSNTGYSHTHILTASDNTDVLNDDSSFTISDSTITEGTSETPTTIEFTVTRTGNLSVAKDINWAVQLPNIDPATIGDFVSGQDIIGNNDGLPSGTLTFNADDITATISIEILADNAVEIDDLFNVLLSTDETNVGFSDDTAVGTITNDDVGFSIESITTSQEEGTGFNTVYSFTITRAGDLSSAATVDYVLAGSGSNQASANDFLGGVFPSGTVNFSANQKQVTLDITVIGDSTIETDEEFTITISNAKLADNTAQNIIDATAISTIVNDDQGFAVTTSSANVIEGNSGTKTITYTITRSGDLTLSSTIDYAITSSNGGNADDIVESALPSGTLTFDAGQDQKTVSIEVIGDNEAENNEAFTLTLSNNSTGSINTPAATVTIDNDDTSFEISADSVSVTEGASGTTAVTFSVSRSGILTNGDSVSWKLSQLAGLNTSDFVGSQDLLNNNNGLPSGTVTFNDTTTLSQTITINVQGDVTLEDDETLNVELFNPVGGTLGTNDEASTTLLTDDDSFAVSASQSEVWETSTDSYITYTVTRTGSLDGERTLTWTVTGSSGFDAATDLAAGQLATDTITFDDGETSKDIQIQIKGDTIEEADETFTLTLSNAPDNTVFDAVDYKADILVKNEDATFKIEELLSDHLEANTSYVEHTFTVVRSGYLGQSNNVNWAIDFGATDSIDANDLYSGQASSGTLSFANGEDNKTITIKINGDSLLEVDENIKIDLSDPTTGAVLNSEGKDTATGIVENNDAEFNIVSVSPQAQLETDSGTYFYEYQVVRTGNLNQVSEVYWSVPQAGYDNTYPHTYDDTDFIQKYATAEKLTFAANSSGDASDYQTVKVYVNGDTVFENNENFTIQLSNPSSGNSLGANSSYESTITNDDTKVTASFNVSSIAEKKAGESGNTVELTFTRSGYTDNATSFTWYLSQDSYWSNGHSNNGSGDFNPYSGTVSFSAGETVSNPITISIINDDIPEDSESYHVWYSSATNVDAFDTDYLTIVRDESAFYLSNREVSSTSVETLTPGNDLYQRYENDSLADSTRNGNESELVTIDGVEYIKHIFAVERQISTEGTASVDWIVTSSTNSTLSAFDFKDDTLPTGTVSFADGQQWGYFEFYSKADDVAEFNEAFSVYLTNPSAGSSIGVDDYHYDDYAYRNHSSYNDQNQGVLVNDDTWFDLDVSPDIRNYSYENELINDSSPSGDREYSQSTINSAIEGQTITYTITRSGDMTGTDTVDWTLTLPGIETTNESNNDTSTWYKLDNSDLSNVAATNGGATYNSGDNTYTGTLTFEDGETVKYITVDTIDDSYTETWREEMTMTLSNPISVTDDETIAISDSSISMFVLDNDPDPLVSVTNVSTTTTYEDATSNSADTKGADGETVTFTLTRTDLAESDGALDYPTIVYWKLSGLHINSTADNVGEWGVKSYTGNVGNIIKEHETSIYQNSDETYGYVLFADGEVTKDLTITLYADSFPESQRDLTFELVDPTYAYYSEIAQTYGSTEYDNYGPASIDTDNSSVSFTLQNDDTFLMVNGANKNHYSSFQDTYTTRLEDFEGNDVVFTIQREGILTEDILVDYEIKTETTSSGDLGSSLTGTLTLAAQTDTDTYGTHTYEITLEDILVDDSEIEGVENYSIDFTVNSSNTNQNIHFQNTYDNKGDYSTTGTLLGTILDNDTTFTVTPREPVSQYEADNGNNTGFIFDIVRTSGYTGATTAYWKVVPVDMDESDFGGSLPSGSVYFSANQTGSSYSKAITVNVTGDIFVENNESFKVVVYQEVNSYFTNDTYNYESSTVTVLNEDTGISIGDAVITESDTDTTIIFTVTRTGDLSRTTTMDWALNHLTTNADDFTGSTTGSLTFNPTDSSKTISLTVKGDVNPENAENFTVNLSNFNSGGVDEVIDSIGGGTIKNDDNSFSIFYDAEASDAAEGGTQYFIISRSKITEQNQTINWSISYTDTSSDSTDFTGQTTSGSVTFTSSDGFTKQIAITSNDDTTAETDEDFNVVISLGAGTDGDTITTDTANSNILNNDATYTISADDVSKVEGDSGVTDFTFTVSRTGSSLGPGSVEYTVSPASGSTLTAADFVGGSYPSGTVNFIDGENEKIITISVVSDEVLEANEAFDVVLSNGISNSNPVDIVEDTATSTITNDDSSIAITALSADKPEGNSGTTEFTFTIDRTGYLASEESVTYTITGTGIDSADFNSNLTGTVVLPENESSVTLTLLVNGDLTAESDEDFTVTLSNPSPGVSITTASANGTIQADDVVFSVSGPANPITEGDSGITYFDFVVTRSGDLSGTQTLNWSVVGVGSDPTVAVDFDGDVLPSNTITFNPSDTTVTIRVPVKGDTLGEANESFELTLSGDSGLIFTNSSAEATIIDDEASLRVEAPTSQAEGNSGTTTYSFVITRTGNTALEGTVDWQISGDIDADDFVGGVIPSDTITWVANETSRTIDIEIIGDTTVESSEDMTLTLSNPTGGNAIVTANDTTTIISDEIQWNITSKTIPSVEGDGTSSFVYTISRTGSEVATSIDYSVISGLTNGAIASDFDSSYLPTDEAVVFENGVMSKDITILVNGDDDLEENETFTVELNASDTDSILDTYNNQTVDTIINNDDDVMSIVALESNKVEGTDGTTAFTFTVNRVGSIDGVSTVGWRIVHGDTVDADFSDVSGTVTFADQSNSETLTINVIADRDLEGTENFQVELYNPGAGSTIDSTSSIASGSIADDDVDLTLTATNVNVKEGDNGTAGTATFTITRTGDLTQETVVSWQVLAGTAVAADFGGTLPSGDFTFAANETSKTISVDYFGDGLDEADETFTVNLFNQTASADIAVNNVQGTIVNDDDTFSIESISNGVIEGNTGTVEYIFKVVRTNSDGAATVDWEASGTGTHALLDSEIATLTGSVTLSDGELEKEFRVTLNSDTVGEYDETFQVQLVDTSFGSSIDTDNDTAIGTVINDDAVIFLSSDDASKLEGNDSSETIFTFTVTRSGDITESGSADWTVVPSGNNPVNALDFGGAYPNGVVTFGAGQDTAEISLIVYGDNTGEFDETFSVELSNPVNLTILEGTASTEITNDDKGIYISVLDSEKNEGNDGDTTEFTFRVSRVGELDAVDINWSVESFGEYPVDAADFGGTLPSGVLEFDVNDEYLDITIDVTGDNILGGDETFKVVLDGENIIIGEASGKIINDDSKVSIQTVSGSESIVEGDSGLITYSFEVTRTGDLTKTASVDYEVVGYGDSAANENDFVGLSYPTDTVVFGVGEDSKIITVQVNGDTVTEEDESFAVRLVNPGSGVEIEPNNQEVVSVIETDDTSLELVAVNSGNFEGKDGESTGFVYEILRTGSLEGDLTVDYTITGANITSDDFVDGLTGTFTMLANEATQTITIYSSGDSISETDENFTVTISGTGFNIITNSFTNTILNDDIYGTSGNDVLLGTDGNDTMTGGDGNDTMTGGDGADRFVFESSNNGLDLVTDFVAGVDEIGIVTSGFNNISLVSKISQNFDTDISTTIAQLASQTDADIYAVNFDSNFTFKAGSGGSLDELETAITEANHTGSSFFLVSDGTDTKLYFDADTDSGTDGTGLVEIAEFNNVIDATTLINDVVEHTS